jgi:sulfotransferase
LNTLHSARRWHFISGLPRSGSTLLAAILRQNNRVSADISSPVFGLCSSLINQVSAGRESSPLIGVNTRKRLIRGLFENYYSEQELPIIFDTNRAWTSELGLLKDLFPDSKVIVCVRDVGWIMDSLERLYQADPYEATRLFQFGTGRSTVYSRLEPLAQHDQLVGFAWSALRQAFYGPHASRLLIIDYDLLCDKPCDVLRLIYQFIGEDYFDHDFDSVEFESPEFDHSIGIPGLHSVRPKVEYLKRQTILPPDLFEKFSRLNFWSDTRGSQAYVMSRKELSGTLNDADG